MKQMLFSSKKNNIEWSTRVMKQARCYYSIELLKLNPDEWINLTWLQHTYEWCLLVWNTFICKFLIDMAMVIKNKPINMQDKAKE